MKEKDIEVVDFGVDKYYLVVVKVVFEFVKEKKLFLEGLFFWGLLVCGMGVGVSIFVNKFVGVYVVLCNFVDEVMNVWFINNINVFIIGVKVVNFFEVFCVIIMYFFRVLWLCLWFWVGYWVCNSNYFFFWFILFEFEIYREWDCFFIVMLKVDV